MSKHPFQILLENFIPQIASKQKQLNKALWILETTGSQDAADLKTDLDTEYRLLFHDQATYKKLLAWQQDTSLIDPLLKRQLNVLIRSFKPNTISPSLIQEIAQKETALLSSYANFRPSFEGNLLSENQIREILKHENSPTRRQKAWEASKEIGELLAPQILALVKTRNSAAESLGYSDYFTMQLDLQEVDASWLFATLDRLAQDSSEAYINTLKQIEHEQSKRFSVDPKALGPWAWSDPFCQEDPLNSQDLDALVVGRDITAVCTHFYERMGIDVRPILARSDMLERAGKNQHAFCINIDRGQDVRTLNNVQPTIKWLETVLHEFGHAIYEIGFDPTLPWLLKEPPHMITTEAMALLAGRQAYTSETGHHKKSTDSLIRRQLIFSRWVLVMTYFEKELYRHPNQDLNQLWWTLVEKYQKIQPPSRAGKNDWAAKYHIGLAPVYYFSYLLGEMLASTLEEILPSKKLDAPQAGAFLNQKLFAPGNSMSWAALIQQVTGKPLNPDAWLHQFAK